MNEIGELKKIVSTAYESVKHLQEPLRTEGFKLILKKLLEKDLKKTEIPIPTEKISEDGGQIVDEDPIAKLAQICSCSRSDMLNIIAYENNNFVLLKKIPGKSLTEKQQKTSLCILTAWLKTKKGDWIDSTTLGKALYNSGVSNDHLGDHLRRQDELFTIKGTRRAAKYRLTAPGWQKGLELLKSLLN